MPASMETSLPQSTFEQELNRLIAPVSKCFSDDAASEKKSNANVETSGTHVVLDAPPSGPSSSTLIEENSITMWQKEMTNTLRHGYESIQAVELIQQAVESLYETLVSVEEGKRRGILSGVSPAAALTSSDGAGRETDDTAKSISTCLSQLEGLYRELDSPTLDVSSSRFASLIQELCDAGATFKTFSLPSSVREDNCRKIFFALDKSHTLLRDVLQHSINECKKAVHNSSVLQESVAPICALQSNVSGLDWLSTPEISTNHINAWKKTFTAINNAFLLHLEPYAPLCRLLEFVEDGMRQYAEPGYSMDASLAPLFDTYIQSRTHFLTVILRWWLRQGSTSPSVDAKAFPKLEKSVRTSPVERESSKPVEPAEESLRTLPDLVEEIVMMLEAFTELEKDVVDRVWLKDDFALGILPQMLTVVSEQAYSVFRSQLLRVDDVSELAETIEGIEKVRVYCSKQKWVKVADLWVRMIQDTQERLIFRASMYLRQNIASDIPTVAWATKFRALREEVTANTHILQAPPALEYFTTFPLTAALLKALHRTLTSAIFSVLAEEAIRLCLMQVLHLGRLMRAANPPDELITVLTELTHIHFLYHHLSSMDTNITVVEKKLDIGQSLRHRKIKIVESSRESMQSVENQFAASYQKLVEEMIREVSAPTKIADTHDAEKRAAVLEEMKKITNTQEQLLLRCIPDQWLRAKILLPVYQFVESYKS